MPNLLRFTLFVIGVVHIFLSCSDAGPLADLTPLRDPIVTAHVDFDGQERLLYRVTGPSWEDPNRDVGRRLWTLGKGGINDDGVIIGETRELVAYCSGGRMLLTFQPAWNNDGPPQAGSYAFRGRLFDKERQVQDLFSISGDLEIGGDGYRAVQVTSAALAEDTAAKYRLELTHTYRIDAESYSHKSVQPFAQTWRCPREQTPLYRQVIEWGSQWVGGAVTDKGESTENHLAQRVLKKMTNLEEKGYRYGAFPRPDKYDDCVEVFLDFKQSACGEFRCFFMALLETQGIDANWLLFSFAKPRADWYSMYETFAIPAFGRSTKVWRYSNHIVVEVNGVVYDPVYQLISPDADIYEDKIFDRYCWGEDHPCRHANDWCTLPSGPQGKCIDNPPGYDPQIGLDRFRGQDYK